MEFPPHFVGVGPEYGRGPVLVKEVSLVGKEEVALARRHGFLRLVVDDCGAARDLRSADREKGAQVDAHRI